MFERVLLAVDGSEHSERAIAMAIDIAGKSHGEIVVVHVREHVVNRGGSWDVETPEDAEAILERAGEEIARAGVEVRKQSCRSLVGAGYVAESIVDVAEAAGSDLIVMGSRGISDLRGLLLGSVTHKVLHLSTKPLLLAR
jgi:nucleotide-binding universal stress UspA family protein